ncbi:polynucleotide kinase 3 phosphatase-domain-containing protein [Paraphoma chrysanthemicola]|uniref:Polynucleotide kinase 3 phosphatase-domain-containing protein n=1 Tax=Paraphoma chrysanthemicola TaxID=798071 RepID=A0A8K0W476_9PLEO|nr:polynucleotide kinase 3 phosphatase-domain-containing protein [Paraphoma chrysanthemicola]
MAERPGLGKRQSSNDRGVSPPPSKRKQQSTTTNKAVANFFTPASKKEPSKMSWRIVKNSLLVGRYAPTTNIALQGRAKVAAFDFDSTLITSASGKVFSRDASDWKWWHSSVPTTLKRLHEEGYLVAIVSNQGGISLKSDPKTVKSDQKRLSDFKQKVSVVLSQLDIPCSVYAATSRDQYRKPRTAMWDELLDEYDLDDVVDLNNSFFVGDAGGREAIPGGVKDHSCVDRHFAANVGIPFHTPEEYFLHEEPRPFTRDFDPTAYIGEHEPELADQSTSASPAFTKPYPLDIVLFCGSPGAGKSSYYWRTLQPLGYSRVNQDILKTREKCIKTATALIQDGTSVVIDNTNADPDTRAVWVSLAQKLNVPIRCVLFTAPAKLCEHNDTFRALNIGTETNPESRSILPKLAFTGFASRYREPKVSEGFAEIIMTEFKVRTTRAGLPATQL